MLVAAGCGRSMLSSHCERQSTSPTKGAHLLNRFSMHTLSLRGWTKASLTQIDIGV